MSSIYFNQEHLMLQKMVREFAINEIKPLAQKIDQEGLFPTESIKKIDVSNYPVDALVLIQNSNKKNTPFEIASDSIATCIVSSLIESPSLS